MFQDKARTFLLREKEFLTEISGGSDGNEELTTDDKISAYESLLMDCKEAIEVIQQESAPQKLELIFSLSSILSFNTYSNIYYAGIEKRFN